jgi:hypothetical protein
MNNRMTRRTAVVLVALMMIAVPATAAVITQNFMRADVTLNAACFTKTAGNDAAGSGFLTFTESTVVDPGRGVTLFQERTELDGFAGDRMIYSDAVRFNNNCGHQIQVSLVSQNDPAGAPALEPDASGPSIWDDVNVKIYLATGPGDPGIPSDSNAGWELMLTVDNGGTVTQGGSVFIGNATDHRLAFVVDTQAGLTPIPIESAIIRWTAQAVHP